MKQNKIDLKKKDTDLELILSNVCCSYTTPERFYIEPNGKGELVIIDRITHSISLVQRSASQIIPEVTNVRKVCGILGVIRIISGNYLVVATHRVFVGFIRRQVVWRLAGFDLIPYMSLTHLTETQKAQNDIYLDMIKNVLDTPYFYFSYTYDLTHCMQRIHRASQDFFQRSIFDRADRRFVWNGYIMQSFCNRPELRRYCLPLILGFVSIHQVNVNGHYFSFTIISRRSTLRAGSRLFSRGIDHDGNCSNYVETEQIVEYVDECISFVQTRGSIPLFWQQRPTIKYKPFPTLEYGKDHQTACIKHLDNQVMVYGKQVLVNLIDHRGKEEALEKAFRYA